MIDCWVGKEEEAAEEEGYVKLHVGAIVEFIAPEGSSSTGLLGGWRICRLRTASTSQSAPNKQLSHKRVGW